MPTRQSTEPRRLITEADIRAAIAWRTAGLDPIKLLLFADRVAGFEDLRADDPAVSALLLHIGLSFPNDRREPWTLLCALAAQEAAKSVRHAVFYSAGMVVVLAAKKTRQPEKRACDALSSLIAGFLGNHPRATPLEIWENFTYVTALHSDVLSEYDPDADILLYYPDAADQGRWADINYETFARRVRRVRDWMRADHGRADSTTADVRAAA